jgi:hypothetical protein
MPLQFPQHAQRRAAVVDFVLGHELVVTFTREGEVVERFYCANGAMAWRITLIVVATHGDELQAGDVISVEQRRRGNLIERGLG